MKPNMYVIMAAVLFLAGCSDSQTQQTINNAPQFQAAVGTYNTDAGVLTHFKIHTQVVGDREEVTFRVTGPEGWNLGEPWTATHRSGIGWLLDTDIPAVGGEFSFSTMIGGVMYTDSMQLDADQILDQISDISITQARSDAVTATWTPLDRADEYWVYLIEAETSRLVDFQVLPASFSSATFTELELATGVEYHIRLAALSFSPRPTPEEFNLQIDSSLSFSEPFGVEGAE